MVQTEYFLCLFAWRVYSKVVVLRDDKVVLEAQETREGSIIHGVEEISVVIDESQLDVDFPAKLSDFNVQRFNVNRSF